VRPLQTERPVPFSRPAGSPSRSAHQLKFHSAFERATARVLYKEEWGTRKPAIMDQNNWNTCPSEVLIRCAVAHPAARQAITNCALLLWQHSPALRQGALSTDQCPFFPRSAPYVILHVV